jgi:hypothetical protein
VTHVRVTVAGKDSRATLNVQGRRAEIHLEREVFLKADESSRVVIA